MTADAHAHELHARFSRGETLTPEERVELDAWYTRLDAEELADMLPRLATMPTVTQEQVDDLRAKIRATADRIRRTEAQNHELRQKIRALENQLGRPAGQPL